MVTNHIFLGYVESALEMPGTKAVHSKSAARRHGSTGQLHSTPKKIMTSVLGDMLKRPLGLDSVVGHLVTTCHYGTICQEVVEHLKHHLFIRSSTNSIGPRGLPMAWPSEMFLS